MRGMRGGATGVIAGVFPPYSTRGLGSVARVWDRAQVEFLCEYYTVKMMLILSRIFDTVQV